MNKYNILTQQYGLKFNKSEKIDLLAPGNSNAKQGNVICFRTPTDGIDKNTFHMLRKLKFMTILQPIDFSQTESRYFLTYKDVLQYCLDDAKFNYQFKTIYGLKILLQLALTYDEFQRRNINWPLRHINQLYFIDEMVYITLIEYEYGQKNEEQNMTPYIYFYSFIQKYFLDTFPELQYYLNFGDATNFKILDFLLEKNGNLNRINHLSTAPPYEDVLKYLLKVDKIDYIYSNGNSVVGEFITPQQLSNIYDLGSTISDQYKDQITLFINREIQLMEYFEENHYMVVCFSYLRIKQHSFLLEKRYAKTLAEVMPTLKSIEEKKFKKGIYNIAYKFSQALNFMHNLNIIHRDLKPENLFVDCDDPSGLSVFIADFDRSKQLENTVNPCQTYCDSNTLCYDPPEMEQTLKYDIFQFGLILLNVANHGVYVGERCGPRTLDFQQKFEQYYSKHNIEQILQNKNFDQEFINLIVNCLQKDYNKRPNAQQAKEILQKIYLPTKIVVKGQIQSNNQAPDDSQQKQLFSFSENFSQVNNNMNNTNSNNNQNNFNNNNSNNFQNPVNNNNINITNQNNQNNNMNIINNNTNNNNGYQTQQFQAFNKFQFTNSTSINQPLRNSFKPPVFNLQNQQNQAQQQNQLPSYFGPFINQKK